MSRYVSKGEWFDEGTEATLLPGTLYTHGGGEFFGLFEGLRNGEADQEVCCLDEFDVLEGGEE